MSFTKNLTRALNTQPLRQQQRHLTYASAEPLEYRLSKLSLSKIKQESARPEPDLRHVVGYASVNRAAGDKMYQNLVRSVELLRTEKKSARSRMAQRGSKDPSLAAFAKGCSEDLGVETRCVSEREGRGRKRRSGRTRGMKREKGGEVVAGGDC